MLVVNDARMREVYWAAFERADSLVLAGVERVSAAIDVTLPAGEGAWAAAGRGLKADPELAERCRVAGASLYPELLPRASEVLASGAFRGGERPDSRSGRRVTGLCQGSRCRTFAVIKLQ